MTTTKVGEAVVGVATEINGELEVILKPGCGSFLSLKYQSGKTTTEGFKAASG